MEVNYDFVPEYESFERKKKSDLAIFSICQGFFSVKLVLSFLIFCCIFLV